MTNEELKKKIVEIIINAIWKDAEADYDSTDETEAGSIADALIAAGIGDIREAEYRAEVAERALQIADELGELCGRKEDYVQQSENELQEEKKSD